MLAEFLLPWLRELSLDDVRIDDNSVQVFLTAICPEAQCPLCSQVSQTVHSSYGRTVADLPWAGHSVRLHLQVRRFFCRHESCARSIFTERLPQMVAPYARRTQRLHGEQRQLAITLGGKTAARTAGRQGMPASARTLLRDAHSTPIERRETPRLLGVDDWAQCKGQTYGTILVDLERHCPVDLLPDRSAASLEKWLQQHPGIEVITRDRAADYAEGATRGAPEAEQVADRFHLLQNVREAVQRLLERHQTSLRAASQTAEEELASDGAAESEAMEPSSLGVTGSSPQPEEITTAIDSASAAASEPATLCPSERRRQESRARRMARYEEVRRLYAAGISQRQIARQLHLGVRTVRTFVTADQFPERATRRPVPGKLDSFVPYLCQQMEAGRTNGMQLWRELREQYGYRGS